VPGRINIFSRVWSRRRRRQQRARLLPQRRQQHSERCARISNLLNLPMTTTVDSLPLFSPPEHNTTASMSKIPTASSTTLVNLTVTTSVVEDVSRQGRTLGRTHPRWRTPEFYIYYLAVILVIPLMIWIPISVSSGGFEQHIKSSIAYLLQNHTQTTHILQVNCRRAGYRDGRSCVTIGSRFPASLTPLRISAMPNTARSEGISFIYLVQQPSISVPNSFGGKS